MIEKKKIFIGGILIFFIGFVFAVSTATNVIFSNNVTSLYDEGSFFVNWTAGGDVAANYSIYIFSNNTFYLKANNNSATGYSFSNTTEANYTFIIEPTNATGSVGTNSSNISIYVDSSAPTISLPNYTNSTLKRNTQDLTLNISVADSLSGLTNSACLIDVNGTNQSITPSNGWCNSTAISLSGLADGNHTIKVYANDTVNNLGLNNSFSVQIDTTAPSPSSLTLSSSSTNSLVITFSGADGTCTASGTGTKSISGSTLTVTGLNCGNPYSYTVTCTDTAGNAGTSSSTSFSTTGCGGSYTPSFWTSTFVVEEDQFTEGFTRELSIKNRMKVVIDNEDHYVGVIELNNTSVKVNVSSNPQQATLKIGDSTKFEVTGDDSYDLLVTLNSIKNNKANVTILSISEKMPTQVITGESKDKTVDNKGIESPKEKGSLTWLWISLALIVIIVLSYLFIRNKI